MREIHAALERFDAALTRLETALADPARSSGAPVDDPTAAGLIERLRRENETLRAARAREASLRAAALRRVDVAIAALESAITSRGEISAPAGRALAMFGSEAAAEASEMPNGAEKGRPDRRRAAAG